MTVGTWDGTKFVLGEIAGAATPFVITDGAWDCTEVGSGEGAADGKDDGSAEEAVGEPEGESESRLVLQVEV